MRLKDIKKGDIIILRNKIRAEKISNKGIYLTTEDKLFYDFDFNEDLTCTHGKYADIVQVIKRDVEIKSKVIKKININHKERDSKDSD